MPEQKMLNKREVATPGMEAGRLPGCGRYSGIIATIRHAYFPHHDATVEGQRAGIKKALLRSRLDIGL